MSVKFEYTLTDNSDLIKSAAKESILRALEAVGIQAESWVAMALEGISPSAKGSTSGLLQSINHEVDPNEPAVYVGSRLEYAIYVHEGTGKYNVNNEGTVKERWAYQDELTGQWHMGYPQKPRRFLKQAIEANLGELREIFLEFLQGKE